MPVFFETRQKLGAWLKTHHKGQSPLKIGFRTRPNGHACVAIEDAHAEAMRYGWRAGRKTAIDPATYAVVFKPSAPGDRWKPEELELAQALIADGKMSPHGLKAYEARSQSKTKQTGKTAPPPSELSQAMMAELKRHIPAWTNFHRMPPSHQRKWSGWVMEAKQEETRARRFAKLMLDLSRTR